MPLSLLPPGSLRTSARLLGLLLFVPLALGTALHLVPGLPDLARQQQPLALRPDRPATAQAIYLLCENLRALAVPLLCAYALPTTQPRHRRRINLRALLDAFLAFSVAANVAVLTVALAGYGPLRLAPWLPHLPVEFGAMALALSSYLAARRGALRLRHLPVVVGAAALLLAVAAVLETWGTPHV
jgi:hypothetical protein